MLLFLCVIFLVEIDVSCGKIGCGFTQLCLLSPLTSVMTNIVVDKSADNTEPRSICQVVLIIYIITK